MGEQQAGKWVVPNPQIPRTFGIMNLCFRHPDVFGWSGISRDDDCGAVVSKADGGSVRATAGQEQGRP